jgi:hypothetical protein
MLTDYLNRGDFAELSLRADRPHLTKPVKFWLPEY